MKKDQILFALKVIGNRKCPDCKTQMENGICDECGYGEEQEEESEEKEED